MVSQEKLGKKAGVLGIILGAAGDEGLAELLEGNGIDGVESDPGVGFQERDQIAGGLFEAQADAGLRVRLAQFGQPVMKCLRRCVDGLPGEGAGGGVDEVEIGLLIGTIEADNEIEEWMGVHGVSLDE